MIEARKNRLKQNRLIECLITVMTIITELDNIGRFKTVYVLMQGLYQEPIQVGKMKKLEGSHHAVTGI